LLFFNFLAFLLSWMDFKGFFFSSFLASLVFAITYLFHYWSLPDDSGASVLSSRTAVQACMQSNIVILKGSYVGSIQLTCMARIARRTLAASTPLESSSRLRAMRSGAIWSPSSFDQSREQYRTDAPDISRVYKLAAFELENRATAGVRHEIKR
jgi:hypothetical protein